MFVYLWVMFLLFELHKYFVLAEHESHLRNSASVF